MENKMFNLSPIVFEYNRLAPNNTKPDYSAFLYTPTISVDKAVVVPHTPKESAPTESSKLTTSPKVVAPVQSTIATAYSPIYRTVGGKKERDTAKNKTEFIKTFLPVYRKVLKEKGISEDFAESLVAQAALESAWGYSPIGKHQVVTNNYIGVKVPSRLRGQGKGQMSGTHEEVNGKMIAINDEFMKFNTLEDMARHHIDLLSRNRYQAFSGGVDEFAQRVKNGGYATASNYVSALNGMINSVRNSGVQIAQKGGQIKPNFIQRLEDPNRKHIMDWEDPRRIATHKMGHEYYPDDSGRAIVYPEVQEINGKLVDFTRPPYHSWAGYDSALDRGDYLIMRDLEEARKWVEGYKDRYKNLK